jgi:hypothetical protein
MNRLVRKIVMSKILKIDDQTGTCRIWNGDDFHGTAVLYAATTDDHTCFQCDFELRTLEETAPEQVRSQRLLLQKKGKAVPKIKSHQLARELVVLFGPEVSANDAVAALRRLAKVIRREGLLIGRDDKEGDFLVETAGPKPEIIA